MIEEDGKMAKQFEEVEKKIIIAHDTTEAGEKKRKLMLKMEGLEKEIAEISSKLNSKDSLETVQVGYWSAHESRRFKSQRVQIDIQSEYDITKIEKDGDGCDWNISRTSKRVYGTVQGHFMRGLQASVTAYTTKRLRYAAEIVSLKQQLDANNSALASIKQEFKVLESQDTPNTRQKADDQLKKLTIDQAVMAKLPPDRRKYLLHLQKVHDEYIKHCRQFEQTEHDTLMSLDKAKDRIEILRLLQEDYNTQKAV